jgi:peptidyl-prolyl cis-trans isomerase C
MRARFLGLFLAGAVVFGGCARKTTPGWAPDVPSGDIVIAKIGNEVIRGKDLDYKIKLSNQKLYTDYKNAHNWRMILDTMIEQRLVTADAEKHGLTKLPEFKTRMDIAKQEILNAMYVRNVINKEAAPTDEELRQAYEEGKENLRVKEGARVSHILLKTREEAEETRQELLKGAYWDAMVGQRSMDTKTKNTNGVLGWISADKVIPVLGVAVPELLPAAMATEVNGYSEPVHSALGWHILLVQEKRAAGTLTFDEVKDNIRDRMINQKSHEIYPKRMQDLRNQYKVEVYEDKFLQFMNGPLDDKQLFNLAQQSNDPKEKISYYQQIVDNHPDGDYSDRAQFMIGFTYSEELKDFDQAQKAFQAVLDKYPKSELVESARWMIDNMRKTGVPNLPEGVMNATRSVQRGS